jgi:hypothetical protein
MAKNETLATACPPRKAKRSARTTLAQGNRKGLLPKKEPALGEWPEGSELDCGGFSWFVDALRLWGIHFETGFTLPSYTPQRENEAPERASWGPPGALCTGIFATFGLTRGQFWDMKRSCENNLLKAPWSVSLMRRKRRRWR